MDIFFSPRGPRQTQAQDSGSFWSRAYAPLDNRSMSGYSTQPKATWWPFRQAEAEEPRSWNPFQGRKQPDADRGGFSSFFGSSASVGAAVAAVAAALFGCTVLWFAGIAWRGRPHQPPTKGAPPTSTVGFRPTSWGMLKAVGYAPVPLRQAGQALPDDDFMSPNTSALWGASGRQDLRIIRSLGANSVRLYGNDPLLDHTQFLAEAQKEGLQVIAGISDYPYTQMEGSCKHSSFDCYAQIRDSYLGNLQLGFLQGDSRYHPSLHSVVLINEPDLKLFHDHGTVGDPKVFCRAIVSAFDGVLDAEKQAGVEGAMPNFTATFSFGVCHTCRNITGMVPAIGQMLELREAMRNPKRVGYTARNDLWDAFQRRWTSSVNTENNAEEFQKTFLDRYDADFQGTPVFIGEYHAPEFDQRKDLQSIINKSHNTSSLLIGLAFFEFQVRYDKGGVGEMQFGMFGLGDKELSSFYIRTKKVNSHCLHPIRGGEGAKVIHMELTEAFGGTGIHHRDVCPGTAEDEIRRTVALPKALPS